MNNTNTAENLDYTEEHYWNCYNQLVSDLQEIIAANSKLHNDEMPTNAILNALTAVLIKSLAAHAQPGRMREALAQAPKVVEQSVQNFLESIEREHENN